MSAQFIGEKIEVEATGRVKQPVAFTWRDRTYQITAIEKTWFDWGFSAGASQRNWRTRRHRNYFQVRADDGGLYEIYLDRGPSSGEGEWFLYQRS